MIQFAVHPVGHPLFDVAKVHHHAPAIQGIRLHMDFQLAVMTMEVLALSIVIKEPVPIREAHFTDYGKHYRYIL